MNIIIPLHTFYIPRLCPITFTGPPQQIDNNVLCRSVTQQGTLARRRDTSSSAPGGSSIQPEGAITMGLGRGCHAPVVSVAGRRSNSGHPQTAAAQAARGAGVWKNLKIHHSDLIGLRLNNLELFVLGSFFRSNKVS